MHRTSFTTSALLAGVAALAVSACGSSTPPAGSATPGGGGAGSGSDFCQQAVQFAAQLRGISAGLVSSPGAVPSVDNYHQVFAAASQAVDNLDGSAPSEIAPAFHQLRAAYDQLNTQVQAATSVEQMSTAFTGLESPNITAATTTITDYFKTSCGISASP